MSTDKPNRRWYQFSMRTLLVVMLVFCVTVGWVGSRIYHAQRNSERVDAAVWASELANEKAVAQINMIGGSVDYFFKDGNTQSWLQKGFDDPGDDVSICQHVRFGGGSTSDADLAVLKRLSDVQSIEVSDTNITDAGLEHLKGLTNLVYLNIENTHITDNGLEQLKGLTNLEYLLLGDKTNVTDEGVKKLQQALPNCKIHR